MKIPRLLVLTLMFAVTVCSAEQTLRSIDEVNAFIIDSTPRKTSFEIVGKVLSVHPSANVGEIVLADSFGARAELYRLRDRAQPKPGDTIRASGKAIMSPAHEPFVRIDEMAVLSHDTPPEPVYVRLSDTDPRTHHLMIIRTEGVVIDAFTDEVDQRFTIILLKDRDVVIPVSVVRDVFGDCRNLIDARIRVTGIYRRSVGGVRKFSWPNINPHTPEDITVITPPPKTPSPSRRSNRAST